MEFSANDIAALLNGEVEGDGNVKVGNISKIDQGVPGTLSFLSNPAYEKYLYTTLASIVLVNKSFVAQQALSCTLIRVDDAYASLAKLLDLYEKMRPKKTGIEQPSYIDTTAQIGDSCYIGAFAYLGRNVKIGNNVKIYPQVYLGDRVCIGDNTILYAGVKIYDDCSVGSNCILHSGAVVGADGFGFAPNQDGTYTKIAQIGNVVVEDNVEVGANTTIDRATMGSTFIRKGVKLDNLVQIAHNDDIGENTVMAAQVGISGSTHVGKNCVFGGQAGISGHAKIGDYAKIGPQTGVLGSIDAKAVVLGSPAMDYKQAMRAYAVIKNLPELRNDVIDLKKQIKKSDK